MRVFLEVTIKLFQAGCFVLAGYMTFLQFQNFRNNNDLSMVSFRKFNAEPHDLYPTFSICIKGKRGQIFNPKDIWKDSDIKQVLPNITEREMKVFKRNGMQQIILRNILKGKLNPINAKHINFDNSTLDFIGEFKLPLPRIKKLELPKLYNSYQDFQHLCFSKNVTFEKDKELKRDGVVLYANTFLRHDISLLLFVHHKGTLLRHLLSDHDPSYEIDHNEIRDDITPVKEQYSMRFTNYKIQVRISQVEVLRKRSNGVIACNESLHDEDVFWRTYVIAKLECIPIFWKRYYNNISLSGHTLLNFTVCNDREEYAKLWKSYLKPGQYSKTRKNYLTSCNQTTMTNNVQEYVSNPLGDNDTIQITFNYIHEEYKETKNIKAFNEETLLSTIGGYIGIFLGYSFLQLATLMGSFLTWIKEWIKPNTNEKGLREGVMVSMRSSGSTRSVAPHEGDSRELVILRVKNMQFSFSSL